MKEPDLLPTGEVERGRCARRTTERSTAGDGADVQQLQSVAVGRSHSPQASFLCPVGASELEASAPVLGRISQQLSCKAMAVYKAAAAAASAP